MLMFLRRNRSRVGGDNRIGKRSAGNVLPDCVGRSDRRELSKIKMLLARSGEELREEHGRILEADEGVRFSGGEDEHLADLEQLLGLLDRLVDSGKSVIVIEHHQAVMAHADWIIDLGPGAGHDGGRIVFEGTPADLVAAKSTLTGEHLAAFVGNRAKAARSR